MAVTAGCGWWGAALSCPEGPLWPCLEILQPSGVPSAPCQVTITWFSPSCPLQPLPPPSPTPGPGPGSQPWFCPHRHRGAGRGSSGEGMCKGPHLLGNTGRRCCRLQVSVSWVLTPWLHQSTLQTGWPPPSEGWKGETTARDRAGMVPRGPKGSLGWPRGGPPPSPAHRQRPTGAAAAEESGLGQAPGEPSQVWPMEG